MVKLIAPRVQNRDEKGDPRPTGRRPPEEEEEDGVFSGVDQLIQAVGGEEGGAGKGEG